MLNMPRLSISLHMVAAFLASIEHTHAFSTRSFVSPPQSCKSKCRKYYDVVVSTTATTTSLHLERPFSGRHFQLEELEDAETSTTDVLLNADMTVTLGGTNGPLYIDSYGTWSDEFVQDDQNEAGEVKQSFQMKLSRKFITGVEEKDTSTNIGEFEYEVERTYKGQCFLVGGSLLAMDGEILDVDEIFGDRRVGFFNMIDTTEERENNSM